MAAVGALAGIDIAAVNKFYDLAVMQSEVPASIREHYRALDAAADDCTACAACEPRCPFGVPIAERMEKAAELLRGTEDKTYRIAEQTGYLDPNYFSYVFKKHFGVSPTKFRAG